MNPLIKVHFLTNSPTSQWNNHPGKTTNQRLLILTKAQFFLPRIMRLSNLLIWAEICSQKLGNSNPTMLKILQTEDTQKPYQQRKKEGRNLIN